MPKEQVLAPASEPVQLQTALDELRITDAGESARVERMLKSARGWAENYLGRSLITQTWDQHFDTWYPHDGLEYIKLERPPVQSITSIKFFDADGVQQTLDSSVYLADLVSIPARIYLAEGQSWPTHQVRRNAITVRFIAGYGDLVSDVPASIRDAILMKTCELYDRGAPLEAAKDLLWQHRIVPL